MEYGTESTRKSYFNNKLKSVKVEYSIPILIQDRSQALSEIMKALELITDKKTHKVTISIETEPKSYYFRLLTKSYIVDVTNE